MLFIKLITPIEKNNKYATYIATQLVHSTVDPDKGMLEVEYYDENKKSVFFEKYFLSDTLLNSNNKDFDYQIYVLNQLYKQCDISSSSIGDIINETNGLFSFMSDVNFCPDKTFEHHYVTQVFA